jgi:hypothetical protein
LLPLLLGSCSNTAWQLSAGEPPPASSTVHVHSTSGIAAAFGLAIIAAGAYEVARSGAFAGPSNARPPEMAPDRKISEQDCSKPIDYTLGNIRCK